MTRMRYAVVAAVAALCGAATIGPAQAAGGVPTVSGAASCVDGAVQFDAHVVGAAIDEESTLTSPQGTFLTEGGDPEIKFYADPIDITWTAIDVPTTSPTITVTLVQQDNPSSAPYSFANPCAAVTTPPTGTGPVISLNGARCPDGVLTLDLHVVKPVNYDAFYELTSPQGTFVYQDSGGETSLRLTNPDTDVVWESTDTSPLVAGASVTLTPDDDTPGSNTLLITNPCSPGTQPPLDDAAIISATATCADGLVQSFTVHGTGFAPVLSTKIGFYQEIDGTEYGQDDVATEPAGADGTVSGTTGRVLDGQLQSRVSGKVTVFLDQNVVADGPAPNADAEITFDCAVTAGGGITVPPSTGNPAQGASPVVVPPVSEAAVHRVQAAPANLASTGSAVDLMTGAGLLTLLGGAGLLLLTRRSARQ